MKHITIISLLSLLLFSPKLFAQEEMQISKHAVELNFFNFDRLYNLNYRRAFVMNKWAVIPKVGLFIDPSSSEGYRDRELEPGIRGTIPIYVKSYNAVNAGIDFLYGGKGHFLQIGINSMASREFLIKKNGTLESGGVLNYAIQPAIGYRYQKERTGLYFSAEFRPLMLRIDAQINDLGDRERFYDLDFRSFPFLLFPNPSFGYSF